MLLTYQRNRSFHIVDWTRSVAKCAEKRSCKACKTTVFHCQICKVVTFWSSSSSWLLKFHKDRVLLQEESLFPARRRRGTCLKFAVKIVKRVSSVVHHDHAFSFPTQLIMHNCFHHAACFTHAHSETPLASNSLKASNSIAPGSMEPILNTCSTAAETFKQTANWLSWTRRRVWAWNRYDIVTSFPARVPVHVSYV